MITSHVMPALARRIETALQKEDHSSGEAVEGFTLILGGLSGEAKPVEDESHRDGEEPAPSPKTEIDPFPDVMSSLGMPISPLHEAPAQGEFPQPVSMAASLTGMMILSAQRLGNSEEILPKALPELQAVQLQKSAVAERLPVSMDGDRGRTVIQIMDGGSETPPGNTPVPVLPHPENPRPAAEVTFAGPKAGEADVTPHPSPAIQILAVITAEAPSAASQPGLPTSSQPAHFGSPALPSPSDVKALRIKLQPEELGEVEVTIRRAGLQTKVTITVTGKAAADAVSKDKGMLEERLGSLLNLGTAPSFNMEIRDASDGQGQSPMTSGGQAFTGAALPDGRSSSRNDRSDRQPQPLRRAGDEHDNENRALSPASGGDRVV